MSIINPYADVDWQNCETIVSVTHAHAKNQEQFDLLYAGGLRHIAISNYYRSEPFYPVVNGKVSGIETVETINIPTDCVPCPNAEHHNMNIDALHICTVGSFFSSGSPEGSAPKSMDEKSWKALIKSAVHMLQFPDAGGLTINHPTWSDLSMTNIFAILDYTKYVLGIEACNTDLAGDLQYWDNVLITGRRAWGFFVPDHKHKWQEAQHGEEGKLAKIGQWRGRNVLIVPQKTEHECLKAYRNGHFFGRLYNTDLSFTNISLSGQNVTYATNKATSITVIEDGIKTTYNGSSCTHTVSAGATYVRAEASRDYTFEYNDGSEVTKKDVIYSQPITFKPFTPRRQDTWEFEANSKKFSFPKMLWL